MRFLVPIVVLLVTSFFVPRGAKEEQAAAGPVHYEYSAGQMETAGAVERERDDDYDGIIESSGMLNRLELLNF